jgi:LysR family transcriptional regulator, hydrogen peroxide-inducible genes activator
MNLSQLRFAAAAASELSFSRAADHCHVTQPTLSSGIALLEDELGGQLFVRTTRKVGLSPFGEQILPLIDSVLRAQAELEAGVRSFYDPSHKVVRIGLSPLVDARLLAQVLEPYEAEHAGTTTFFKECFLDELDDRLRKAQIDMVVRPVIAGGNGRGRVVRAPIYEEDLFYLPKRAREAKTEAGAVEVREVANETFVLGPDGCGLASTTRGLFEEIGVGLKEYTGQALSFQVMQEWADIGIGATILPGSKVAAQFRQHARPLMLAPKRPARIRFECLWMKGAAYPRHVVDLHRHFQKRVPKLVGGGAGRA